MLGLIGAVDSEQRVLVALVEIESACAHGVVWPAVDIIRDITEAALDVGCGSPRRPLFLAAHSRNAVPGQCFFAHGYAVAYGLVVREDVVEITRVGIDDDRPRSFLAMILNDGALVRIWKLDALIRRVGQQPPIARREIGVVRWIYRGLHAPAQQEA